MTFYQALPKKMPEPTGIALGMFDGLHLGHKAVLDAVAAGPYTPCVFTFGGALPKGQPLLCSETGRNSLLQGMGIAHVFAPDFLDCKDFSPEYFAREILQWQLNARFVCCGENFRFGKNAAAGANDLRALLPQTVAVQIVPLVSGLGEIISSSRIRALIRQGQVDAAAMLLGRPFAIDFIVEYGRQLGRTLDFPTINQAFPQAFTVPKFGVYATVSTVNGQRRCSVTNVGVKPTVGSDHVLAETYIHGFNGDLYGQAVLVEFIEFIRPEQKFKDITELKAQIARDNKIAEKIIAKDGLL